MIIMKIMIMIIMKIMALSLVSQRGLPSDSLPLLLEVLHGSAEVRGLPVKGDNDYDVDDVMIMML